MRIRNRAGRVVRWTAVSALCVAVACGTPGDIARTDDAATTDHSTDPSAEPMVPSRSSPTTPSATSPDGGGRPTSDPAVATPGVTVRTPLTGTIDMALGLVPGFVTVSGWVGDQRPLDAAIDDSAVDDSALEDSAADSAEIAVIVDIDGQTAARTSADVDALGADDVAARGYAVDIAVPGGEHEVCVHAVDVKATHDPVPLGCVTASVEDAEPHELPTVSLTAVAPQTDHTVVVRGVLTGPVPDSLRFVIHHGYLPHEVTDPATPAPPTTVTDPIPITDATFRTTLEGLADGHHAICPTIDSASALPGAAVTSADPSSCGSVALGEMSAGTSGSPAWVAHVAPPEGHDLHLMERDGGISTELSDGSVLWFFGDTSERLGGGIAYFISNTAAWAPADAPTETCDAVTPGHEPALFAEPPAGWCSASRFPKSTYWPTAAMTVPQSDGTDRVLVVLYKVCQGTGFFDFEDHGLALAEYVYDPAQPPLGEPIRGEVTVPDLAPASHPYGEAAMLDDDDVYAYDCTFDLEDEGECRVARVAVDDIAELDAWTYWNGGDPDDPRSWTDAREAASPMTMASAGDRSVPLAAFTIAALPDAVVAANETTQEPAATPEGTATSAGIPDRAGHAAMDGTAGYVMVYSPWPVFTERLAVRVAPTPVGPWTAPVEISLPGCRDVVGESTYCCYAATGQLSLCECGLLGAGYFDQLVDGQVAQYRALVTPFVVTP